MLVFRRKVGEAVILDGHIEVQVLEITGSRVKLGFTAPSGVLIVRKELHLTQEENRRAVLCHATDGLTSLVTALRLHSSRAKPNSATALE
jgi:carbon storage regulator CsrA